MLVWLWQWKLEGRQFGKDRWGYHIKNEEVGYSAISDTAGSPVPGLFVLLIALLVKL